MPPRHVLDGTRRGGGATTSILAGRELPAGSKILSARPAGVLAFSLFDQTFMTRGTGMASAIGPWPPATRTSIFASFHFSIVP